jgi:hypothetical protein
MPPRQFRGATIPAPLPVTPATSITDRWIRPDLPFRDAVRYAMPPRTRAPKVAATCPNANDANCGGD